MTALFKDLWINKWGLTPESDEAGVWLRAMKGIDMSGYAAGYGWLMDSGREFPPGPVLFRKMCLDSCSKIKPEAHRTMSRLTKKIDREAAAKGISATRACLRGEAEADLDLLGLPPSVKAAAKDNQQKRQEG